MNPRRRSVDHRKSNGPEPVEQTAVSEPPNDMSSDPPNDALDALYRDAAPLMRYLATRRFGIPLAEAENLVHDVFATYLVNPSRVRDAKAYLIGGICNASRQYLREHRINADRELEECSSGDLVVEATERVSKHLMLATMLEKLSPRCRELLRRFYLDGEPAEQIAPTLGTSTGYIFQILHTCRKRARTIFAELMKVTR